MEGGAISLRLPQAPELVAGVFGGPLIYLFVTPGRNALTLGATNSSAGAFKLYGEVFSHGFLRGWTGGIYPAVASGPSFLVLGPAYHVFAEVGGVPGAVFMCSALESAIMYGSESRNGQLAKNEKVPGTFKSLQPVWKPWGPGNQIYMWLYWVSVRALQGIWKN